ncbi:MAG: 6-carboxytetrahydropterin synthase [Gemmatimonadota bacterium]
MSLSRVVRFHAWHRYAKPDWTEAENRARFGWTTEEPGHPHDYTCTVTVAGPLDPVTSMVIDLPRLDAILSQEVTARLDGKHLNRDIPEFAIGATLPTCEALALDLYARIAARLPAGVSLERVRVAEDPGLYGEARA